MEERCDICGDIGASQAILHCHQCKTNCEHMYCMRVILEEAPEDGWICEECESVPKPLPQPPKRKISFNLSRNQVHGGASSNQQSPSDTRKKPVNWENKPKKPGKTKYLPASEAMKLGVASTSSSPSPGLSSPPRPNVGPYRKRTSAKSKILPLSSIYQQCPASVPSKQSKPQRHSHASPGQQSKEPSEIKRPIINLVSQLPSDKYVCLQKERPSEVKSSQTKAGNVFEKRPWLNVRPVAISEVQKTRNDLLSAQALSDEYAHVQKVKHSEANLHRTEVESVTETRSPAVVPRPNVPPLIISGSISSTIGCSSGIHDSQSLDGDIHEQSCTAGNVNAELMPDSDKASYAPALVVWKGIFNIQGFLQQGNLRHDIQAQVPSRTHRKVFELSQQMPELLDVEMVPRDTIWLKLFPEYIPDGNDIGLYLFPNRDQSCDDYFSLLDYMNANNYALRVQIADVELLVFSSTLLPMNCQFWELKNFLWGVFHRVKGNNRTFLKPGALLSSVPHSVNANNIQKNGNAVDMEIDMIGGVNVGRIDVVSPR